MSYRSPLAAHTATPSELQARIEAAARGTPFLVLRDGADAQRIVDLQAGGDELTIGRGAECDLVLDWDEEVSRLHAQIVRVGGEWVLVDDGLSRNGSYVNDAHVSGRRRLYDGDLVRIGSTVIAVVAPSSGAGGATTRVGRQLARPSLAPSQRRVLVALCRPLRAGSPLAAPASNPEIAAELSVSIEAVRTHMKALYRAFDLQSLPQPNKRATLAHIAQLAGVVGDADYV